MDNLKSTIQKLSQSKSLNNSTSLVTLYVPSTTKISDLNKMITSEISKCTNIKSRQTRKGVADALHSVISQLKRYKSIPSNGIAIFTGDTTEGFESVSIEPQRPINSSFYRCDNKFCV